MNDCLEMIYYMLSKFWTFIFGCYLFEGVSVGMILICSILFSMILNYTLAIPKASLSSTMGDRIRMNRAKNRERSKNES